jgi:hypothetical protein
MYQNSFLHICTQCCGCHFVIIVIVIKNKRHYESVLLGFQLNENTTSVKDL